MGYSITIGAARISYDGGGAIGITADPITLTEAPSPYLSRDHSSHLDAAYSGLSDAMEELGLTDVMFGEEHGGAGHFTWEGKDYRPLISEHPGVTHITYAHPDVVEATLGAYQGTDATALRYGAWLRFWLRWAEEHCKCPVFVNW